MCHAFVLYFVVEYSNCKPYEHDCRIFWQCKETSALQKLCKLFDDMYLVMLLQWFVNFKLTTTVICKYCNLIYINICKPRNWFHSSQNFNLQCKKIKINIYGSFIFYQLCPYFFVKSEGKDSPYMFGTGTSSRFCIVHKSE